MGLSFWSDAIDEAAVDEANFPKGGCMHMKDAETGQRRLAQNAVPRFHFQRRAALYASPYSNKMSSYAWK